MEFKLLNKAHSAFRDRAPVLATPALSRDHSHGLAPTLGSRQQGHGWFLEDTELRPPAGLLHTL